MGGVREVTVGPLSSLLDRTYSSSHRGGRALIRSNAVYLGFSKNISTLIIRSAVQAFPKNKKE